MPPSENELVEEEPKNWSILDQLSIAVSSQKAAFCCGGAIQVTNDGLVGRFDNLTCDDGQATSAPIVIRWDLASGKSIRKLTLPTNMINAGVQDASLIEGFLKHCDPATFGKEEEEVLDESYRKAVKLDDDRFSTNFNPYDVGIVDAIAQTLLPGIAKPFADGKSTFEDHLGVVAELYKLNVYSGPSGRFRAHVDTPRGAKQFGSLVVCLPFNHEGGQLRVAHRGQETIHDWSQSNSAMIRWAAFYSDCEHEVLEVKSGHRITLTYNLYVRERTGAILRQNPTIDSQKYVLHHRVMDALKHRGFMTGGGTLGFYCQYAYAHTNLEHSKRLPYALKGVDAIIFSVFHHLGLDVEVKPVMDMDNLEYEDDESQDFGVQLVGTELHDLVLSEEGGSDGDNTTTEIVADSWPSVWHKGIEWFNAPGPFELGMAHLAYGNQPSMQWHYTRAAILVEIPELDSTERQQVCNR